MKIGINGQRLLVKNPAGPERYTYHLVNALAKIDHDNEYRVYFTDEPSREYFSRLTYSNSSFKPVAVSGKFSWTQVGLARELKNNPVDLLFTPVHTMPIFREKNLKVIGMIHGLEYKFSGVNKNPLKKLLLGKPEEYVSKHSHALIVPTAATKNEIIKKGWRERSDSEIYVIHEGVSESFYKRSDEEIDEVRHKYLLDQSKYLLFVSTIQPRKNIPIMIKAYAEALRDQPDFRETKLLLVGKTGWDAEESFSAPKKFGVEKNVIFLGFLPDEDLPPLFSGAEAFINVSFEEGFGLPLLEAMSCETPAIVSNIPAFREVAGNYAVYAECLDVKGISREIGKIFSGKYPAEKIAGAKERSKNFTWDKTASETLAIFQKVMENS